MAQYTIDKTFLDAFPGLKENVGPIKEISIMDVKCNLTHEEFQTIINILNSAYNRTEEWLIEEEDELNLENLEEFNQFSQIITYLAYHTGVTKTVKL